jgi:hypothetical protein
VANAVLSLLLASVLVTWVRFAWVLRGIGKLPNLARASDEAPAGGWPRLSVIVACRNEEAHVRAALASVLDQDYPGLQVVAVDDRSEDATGAALDALAAVHPSLRVLHVTSLPAGWLGKTNALHRGAAQATGEFLLFTDADVVFSPGALRRAVAWTVRDQLGHAVALPHFVAPGFAERSFVSLFGMFLLIHLRVNEIGRGGAADTAAGHIGVGAFNLVRRSDYDAVGGHTRLRLEVVDDVKLGLILRRAGVRQGAADSGGTVRVRWQRGFVASMAGLVKNFFAGCEYRWRAVLRAAVLVPLATVLPVVCLFVAPHPLARVLAAGALAVPVALLGMVARRLASGRGAEGLLLPVVGPCLAAVALTSAIVTTARGGVVWRGTRYDLRDLRANCVREDP